MPGCRLAPTPNELTEVLQHIASDVHASGPTGAIADYIPALARVPPDQFAMCAATLEGTEHTVGDVDVPFSLQSVTKVFTTAMVLAHPAIQDILLWRRVGVEPSGTKFNALVQLEHEDGVPRNPFINAGAIVVADAFLRSVGFYIDALFFGLVAYVFMDNATKPQRVGDLWGKTVVVRRAAVPRKSERSLGPTLLGLAAASMAASLLYAVAAVALA